MSNNNRDKATMFLTLVATGKVDEGYSTYVAADFKHHNAYFEGSAKALRDGMKQNALENPEKTIDVKQVIAEGEFVVVHFYVRHKPGDIGAAVMHIFRFENGKIVELWDVGQEIPKDSPNQYGMF